jgi:hypothetical protein
MLRRAREREQRRNFDETLEAAVESGANIVMNDTDWTSIHKAARSAARKRIRAKR